MSENYKPTTVDEGAGVVVFENRQVLLIQMNYGDYKGQWILPGGMLEEGEHPHAAAVRECMEETGQKVEVESLLAMRHRIKSHGGVNIYWVFLARLLEDNESQKLRWSPDEIIEAKYWSIEEALQSNVVRPHTQHYIRLAIKEIQAARVTALPGKNDDYCYAGI